MPEAVKSAVSFLALIIEIIGAIVIAVSVGLAIWTVVWEPLRGRVPPNIADLRRRFGRGLVLALEFLVAADILKTSLAPTLQDVAVLAGIIILRTLLSLSIEYELRNLPESSAKPATKPQA